MQKLLRARRYYGNMPKSSRPKGRYPAYPPLKVNVTKKFF